MLRFRTASRVLALALALLPVNGHAERLRELYELALANNPAYKAREFGVDQARAQRSLARSALLPQVSVFGSYSENYYDDDLVGDTDYSSERSGLQARQALFDMSNYLRLESSRDVVAQREEERDAARMALAGMVVDRYLAVLQATDEVGYLQSDKEATLSQLQRLRIMQDRQLAIQPTKLQEFMAKVRDVFDRAANSGEQPALLVSPHLRPHIRAIVERFRPSTPVLSQTEVHPRARIRTVGTV